MTHTQTGKEGIPADSDIYCPLSGVDRAPTAQSAPGGVGATRLGSGATRSGAGGAVDRLVAHVLL